MIIIKDCKGLFFFLVMILVLALMCVCVTGSVLAEQNEVTIKFLGWIGAEKAGVPAKEALIKGFEEKYPNIKVEVIDVPFREIPRRITMMVEADRAPDVAQIFSFCLPTHFAQGALEPLDKYFSKEELNDLVATYKYHGETLAVNWNPGIMAMFYSKKLFQKAGIKELPNNFNEFKENVEKISKLSPSIYGFVQHLDFSPSCMYWHGPWLWSRDGGIWDSSGNVIINNKGSLEQIEMIKEWANEKLIPLGLTGSEPRLLLANHRVGFIADGPWTKGILLSASGAENFEENWGVFPLYKIMPGKPVVSSSDHTLGIFKQSKHKEEAIKFVKYLISEEAATIRYKIQGMLPPKKSYFDLPLFNVPYINAFTESSAYIYNENWTPNNEAISDEIVKAYQKVLYDGKPVKETFDNCAKEVNSLTPEDWFKD